MRKMVLPTIVILVLASVLFLLVAKEYSQSKRKNIKPLSASKEEETEAMESVEDEGPVVSDKRLTAEDTCIVIGNDASESIITLRNILGGEDKNLQFDRTTRFLSKHDAPLTAAEIKVGDIVDISFTTYDSKLIEVKQSEAAWEMKNISNFEIDEKGRTITIADEMYRMAKNSVIGSDNRVGKVLDVTSQDTITVKGIDKDVYSIQIEEGHGYIRVKNDSYFVGGWIEVGQNIITVLTEGMLIPVAEGTYDVKVTNKGYVGRETVDVVRDKETVLDLSKIQIEEVSVGHVLFDIKPDYAQLYVDGLMTDFEERVPLEYGVHSVRVELAGYETVHANIKVSSEMVNISIELDEDLSATSSSEKSSSSSSRPASTTNYLNTASSSTNSDLYSNGLNTTSTANTTSSSSTASDNIISDSKKIYVEGPSGAEVYLDGSYIGIAPCNTTKVTGQHTITLTKPGYETKSYTINVGNDNTDLTMSFSELNATQ